MKAWNDIPFADLLIESRDGEWGKGAPEVGHSEAVVIRGTDFSSINDPGLALPHRWIKEHLVARKKLQPGDILFEMAGGTAKQSTGRSAILKSEFFKRNAPLPAVCASFSRHLRIDQSRFSPEFIYYLLQGLHRSGYMGVFHVQHTGVARFQYSSFKKHTVLKIPELAGQRKIAAILTAYDDLIETNKRRIALLEKMAEEIYREWFVRLRFPGYQNTMFVKGIPEGWELKRFTELVAMNPREKIHKGESIPFVGMDKLSQTSMHFTTDEERVSPSGSKFRNRDTLLPRITPCLENGKRGFVSCLKSNEVGVGSTEFIVFREKVLPAEYIYLLSCNSSFRQHAELSMSGASGRQRVQHDCFDYFFIPEPPEEILQEFVSMVRPMFESVANFAAQNSVLAKTRDLLLPRLISGKLPVEHLDIQTPPSMNPDPTHA